MEQNSSTGMHTDDDGVLITHTVNNFSSNPLFAGVFNVKIIIYKLSSDWTVISPVATTLVYIQIHFLSNVFSHIVSFFIQVLVAC